MDEPTQDQLEKYPPELWPVAKRHGVELLNFALVVAGTNRAVDVLIGLGQRFVAAREPSIIILNNLSTLCEDILKSHGWDMDKVTECISDVGRAQSLTAARPKILLH